MQKGRGKMAGNDVEIIGIEENLKRLAGQNKRVRNKALKTGAELMENRLKLATPRGITQQKKSKDGTPHKHLTEHTTFSNVNANGEIVIGYDESVNYRVHFIELGTIHQMPQAFIQRTQKETEQEFFNLVASELRKGLGL